MKGELTAAQNYRTHGWSASLESGYTFKLKDYYTEYGSLNSWFLQPQLQLTWMGIQSGDMMETNGTRVRGINTNNVQTRMGLRTFLKGHSVIDKDKSRDFEPFIEASWIHNTQHFGVAINGERVYQKGANNLAEVKLGVEGKINNSVNLWGNVGVQVGKEHYSDTMATLGIKYIF
ncbi:hypothetical protein ETAC_14475 [Edwardsiella piscicida C07-087]|nr:hypothetical protein ETAC_14475 [Edwardsiella piscicida C07-087]